MKMLQILDNTRTNEFDATSVRRNLTESLFKSIPDSFETKYSQMIQENISMFPNTIPDDILMEGVKIYVGPISQEDVLQAYNRSMLYADGQVIMAVVPALEGGLSKKKWCLKVKYITPEEAKRRFSAFLTKVVGTELPPTDVAWEQFYNSVYLPNNGKLIVIPLVYGKFYKRAERCSADGIELFPGTYAMLDEGRLWISSTRWVHEIPTTAGKKFENPEGTVVRAVLVFKAHDALN